MITYTITIEYTCDCCAETHTLIAQEPPRGLPAGWADTEIGLVCPQCAACLSSEQAAM